MGKIKNFLVNAHPFFNLILIIVTIISVIFGIISAAAAIRYRNFETKRTIYSLFIKDVLSIYEFANNKEAENIKKTFQNMDNLFLDFEPFLTKDASESLRKEALSYYNDCIKYANRTESDYTDELRFELIFKPSQMEIHSILFKALFGREPSEGLGLWEREQPKDFNPTPGITPGT